MKDAAPMPGRRLPNKKKLCNNHNEGHYDHHNRLLCCSFSATYKYCCYRTATAAL